MKIDGNAVRPGMILEIDGKLGLVVKNEARKPGKGGAYNQVELKDIVTGTKTTPRFNSAEKVERVEVYSKDFNFLFEDSDMLTFMDNETYEQVSVPKDMVGDLLPFLQDGMTVSVETYEDRPISIKLPQKVTVTITEADPVVKGQTASSSYKPAMLENGVRVMVPPFIPSGESIVVDTTTLEYVERAKK